MKQSDIASLIIIVSISLVFSFFIANSFITPPETTSAKIEVVKTIDPNLAEVDESIFNKQAINPAENIKVTEFNTDNIFSGSQ